MGEYPLVQSYKDVVQNSVVFHDALRDSTEFSNKLSMYRHWYYIEELGKFAPSKFIGYKNISLKKYSKGCYTGMDGRETVPHLKKWFRIINESDYNEYYNNLSAFLSAYDKKPNARTYIYIKK